MRLALMYGMELMRVGLMLNLHQAVVHTLCTVTVRTQGASLYTRLLTYALCIL